MYYYSDKLRMEYKIYIISGYYFKKTVFLFRIHCKQKIQKTIATVMHFIVKFRQFSMNLYMLAVNKLN